MKKYIFFFALVFAGIILFAENNVINELMRISEIKDDTERLFQYDKFVMSLQTPEFGESIVYDAGGVKFALIYAPGSEFPFGEKNDSFKKVENNFFIGESEVTYELWYKVKLWATDKERGDNFYTFSEDGLEGSFSGGGSWPNYNNIGKEPTSNRKHPVTNLNYKDVIVWLNALSEYLGFNPVYFYDGKVIRSAVNDNVIINAYADYNSDGFRLPTEYEWELAAKYSGAGSDGYRWMMGNYVSGADGLTQKEISEVAVYSANSDYHTSEVKSLKPNVLGLYDMGGNAWEWCFSDDKSTNRILRGGAFDSPDMFLKSSYRYSTYFKTRYNSFGFRIVKK